MGVLRPPNPTLFNVIHAGSKKPSYDHHIGCERDCGTIMRIILLGGLLPFNSLAFQAIHSVIENPP